MDDLIDWCTLLVIWELSSYDNKLRRNISMWITNSQISKIVTTGTVVSSLLKTWGLLPGTSLKWTTYRHFWELPEIVT